MLTAVELAMDVNPPTPPPPEAAYEDIDTTLPMEEFCRGLKFLDLFVLPIIVKAGEVRSAYSRGLPPLLGPEAP